MADNVAGFNHLDSVLLDVGNQFRQDAIKQAQLEAMKAHYKQMEYRPRSGGGYANQPLKDLQKQFALMQQKHETTVNKMVEDSKDVTGVPKISHEEAEEMWSRTPDADDEAEMGAALKTGLQKENVGIYKPKVKAPSGAPINTKPVTAPTPAPTPDFGGTFQIGGNM